MADPIREIVPDIKQALEAAGYVIVPAEPTKAMIEAGVKADFGGTLGSRVTKAFTAMIRAVTEGSS